MKLINKKFIGVLALAVMISCDGSAKAENINIYNQCYNSKVLGANIGKMCEVQTFDTLAKTYTTKRNYDISISRLGNSVFAKQETVFIEDDKGNPLNFTARNNTTGENVKLEGTFQPNCDIKLLKDINGNKTEEVITPNKKLLFPKAVNDLFIGKTNKFTYNTIDTSTGFRVIEINSVKQEDNKYEVTNDLMPDIVSYESHDNIGKLVKSTTSALDMELVAENSSEPVQNNNLDIIKATLISSNEKFEQTNNLQQVNYKIDFADDSLKSKFPEDDRQSIIENIDNTLFVKIKDEAVDNSTLPPINKEEISEFLKSGDVISFDETMKKTAAQVIAGETNPYVSAKKLEKWVNAYITNKDYSTAFSGSSEVFKSKQGDCTEHSVLLASMLRAVGIPSKVAVGLFYTNTPESSFAYHMWTKAYIANKWVNLDASFIDSTFSPLHIELAESALNSLEAKSDLVLPLISNLSKLKVTVLNFYIKSNPENVDLSEGEQPTVIKTIDLVDSKPHSSAIVKVNLKSENSSNVSDINLSSDDVNESVAMAYLAIAKGEMQNALDHFEDASRAIDFNDDFSNVQLAQKMANAGFFKLAEKQFKNINESEIWKNQISNIKAANFPMSVNNEKEKIYAIATSKLNMSVDSSESLMNYLNQQTNITEDDYLSYLMGKAYFINKDYKNAKIYFDQAVKLNPLNQRYRLDHARCLNQLELYVEAKNELSYLANSVSDELLNNIIISELFLVKSKLAKETMSDKLYYLAKYDALNGDYTKASNELKSLLQKFPKNSKAYSLSGDISYKLNDFDNALISYNKAIKYDAKNEKAYIGVGNIELLNKKTQIAEKMYLNALKINPKNIEVLQKLADIAVKNQNIELAYKYNEEILKYYPLNFNANYYIAVAKVSANQSELASPYFRKALSTNPYSTSCWLELAKIELKKKNYFIARSYLINVKALDAKNAEYYFYMGLIDKANEDFNSARSNFEQASMLKVNYVEAIDQLKSLN
ncbi:MAG: transglutaminase domain-containing protein [bacterium]